MLNSSRNSTPIMQYSVNTRFCQHMIYFISFILCKNLLSFIYEELQKALRRYVFSYKEREDSEKFV